jgi:hypothetical protein
MRLQVNGEVRTIWQDLAGVERKQAMRCVGLQRKGVPAHGRAGFRGELVGSEPAIQRRLWLPPCFYSGPQFIDSPGCRRDEIVHLPLYVFLGQAK